MSIRILLATLRPCPQVRVLPPTAQSLKFTDTVEIVPQPHQELKEQKTDETLQVLAHSGHCLFGEKDAHTLHHYQKPFIDFWLTDDQGLVGKVSNGTCAEDEKMLAMNDSCVHDAS